MMVPSSNGSRPLTHLISVDLPEPDGPHTTTTSPVAISVEHFFSTCTVPYHLLTSRISIMPMAVQRMMATRCWMRRTVCEATSEMTK